MGLEAPDELVRRLRAIRPNAELLYQGKGVWMLGEVRWNWFRYKKGVQIISSFLASREEVGVDYLTMPNAVAFLNEGLLLMQGFCWIADYEGPPDGRIEVDYSRKCWKEEHGSLDAEFYQMAHESSDQTSLLRKLKVAEDRVRSEGNSDYRIVMRRRKSFTATRRVAAAAQKQRAAKMSTGGIITV